ncbi:MAG: sugar ABC transporter permease [Lachnospiraceae bacterium]|nr:sugar ABC transporter permease [Lachnospiraceae bacterium]
MSKEKKATKRKGFSYKSLDFQGKRSVWGVIFLLPWLFGVIFFSLRPLLQTFWYAVCSMEFSGGVFSGTFVGLDNFTWVLTVNADFTELLAEAFIGMAKEVPIQIFLSLFIAILLNGEYKGRGFFRSVFVIPIILATGIATFSLAETSLNEQTAESVVNLDWLVNLVVNSGIPTNVTTMLTSYISNIFEVVTTCGVQVLLFLTGLQAISPTLYEVAKIEGCSAFETFCKVTLPMVSPTILVCLVYSIAESFASATVTYSNQTITFASYIKSITFTGNTAYYGYGAAMSVIYFVVTLATIGIVCGIVNKGVFYYD